MKKSFTLLELILVITLLGVLYSFFKPKINDNRLEEATNRLFIYLKQLRYQSLIDDKYQSDNSLWFKQRWSLKFFRCRQDVGGIYYVVYSDKNQTGQPSVEDSMKDFLTSKNIYSSNFCKKTEQNSEYVLLTQEFGVEDVKLSCNETSSLGQLSFGEDGFVYAKLSNYENEQSLYKIEKNCTLELINSEKTSRKINVNGKNGYIYME